MFRLVDFHHAIVYLHLSIHTSRQANSCPTNFSLSTHNFCLLSSPVACGKTGVTLQSSKKLPDGPATISSITNDHVGQDHTSDIWAERSEDLRGATLF